MKGQQKTDLSVYDSKKSDEEKIQKDGSWVPCRICEEIFHRVTLTDRFCKACGHAFCEGQHGRLANNIGKCVKCDSRAGGPEREK